MKMTLRYKAFIQNHCDYFKKSTFDCIKNNTIINNLKNEKLYESNMEKIKEIILKNLNDGILKKKILDTIAHLKSNDPEIDDLKIFNQIKLQITQELEFEDIIETYINKSKGIDQDFQNILDNYKVLVEQIAHLVDEKVLKPLIIGSESIKKKEYSNSNVTNKMIEEYITEPVTSSCMQIFASFQAEKVRNNNFEIESESRMNALNQCENKSYLYKLQDMCNILCQIKHRNRNNDLHFLIDPVDEEMLKTSFNRELLREKKKIIFAFNHSNLNWISVACLRNTFFFQKYIFLLSLFFTILFRKPCN